MPDSHWPEVALSIFSLLAAICGSVQFETWTRSERLAFIAGIVLAASALQLESIWPAVHGWVPHVFLLVLGLYGFAMVSQTKTTSEEG